ncbi:hypothetical protein O981_27280 [Mycobacterium avium 10-5560]|nr:hypothetical protein O981_27280 [Mycobacterium avium 10-5560]
MPQVAAAPRARVGASHSHCQIMQAIQNTMRVVQAGCRCAQSLAGGAATGTAMMVGAARALVHCSPSQ